MIYECDNGHKAEIDFGEETTAKCPTCGVLIHKFRAKNIQEGQSPESLIAKTETPSEIEVWVKNNWKALAFWGSILAGIALAFSLLTTVFHKEGSADIAAIPGAAPAEVTAPAAVQTDINAISVKDFVATPTLGANVRISFNLTNSNPSNPYPSLLITWVGSQAKPITVTQADYPHPQTAFTTTLPVEFEISRPADATGVKVTAQYPQ